MAVHTNKKSFVVNNPKNVCQLECSNHLWLIFFDQPHSDVVVFAIIYFSVYKILVTEWKHGISTNNIIIFNEELEKN